MGNTTSKISSSKDLTDEEFYSEEGAGGEKDFEDEEVVADPEDVVGNEEADEEVADPEDDVVADEHEDDENEDGDDEGEEDDAQPHGEDEEIKRGYNKNVAEVREGHLAGLDITTKKSYLRTWKEFGKFCTANGFDGSVNKASLLAFILHLIKYGKDRRAAEREEITDPKKMLTQSTLKPYASALSALEKKQNPHVTENEAAYDANVADAIRTHEKKRNRLLRESTKVDHTKGFVCCLRLSS